VATEAVGIKKPAVTKVAVTKVAVRPSSQGLAKNPLQPDDVLITGLDSTYQIPLAEVSDDVEFSTVSNGRPAPSSSAVPGSKMKRLKRMLDVADKKRRRLEELKASGDEGKKRVKEEQWIDAMKSATGDKAVVDTSKLKKAIKRREKQKEASARKWKVRRDAMRLYQLAQLISAILNVFLPHT
jgi:hypothetical protein